MTFRQIGIWGCFLLLVQCKQGEAERHWSNIERMSPEWAKVGDQVKLSGNFPETGYVVVGDLRATIVQRSELEITFVVPDGAVTSNVAFYSGHTADGSPKLLSIIEKAAPKWAWVSVSLSETCASSTDGIVWCWGSNDSGQRSNSLLEKTPYPAKADLPVGLKQFELAIDGTCFASTSAVRNAGCIFPASTSLSKITPLRSFSIGRDIQSLVMRDVVDEWDPTICAISESDGFHCWLVLGDATLKELIEGSGSWRAIAIGQANICAIHEDRSLSCWMKYSDSPDFELDFVDSEFNWSSIAYGNDQFCATDSLGAIRCWQKWDDPSLTGYSEYDLASGRTWEKVYMSESSNLCAIDIDGAMLCQGPLSNKFGAETIGNSMRWKQIAMSHAYPGSPSKVIEHACAISSDGELYCWGENGFGQLGVGDWDSRDIPTKIEYLVRQ